MNDLKKLAADVNSGIDHDTSTFNLTADIDFGGASFEGIGKIEGVNQRSFMGYFNGNYHTISNFKIETNLGFFGITEWAQIYYLKLQNFSILNKNGADHPFGGIVGNSRKNTDIQFCEVENLNVSANGGRQFGGIIGLAEEEGLFNTSTVSKIYGCVVKDVSISGSFDTVGALIGCLSYSVDQMTLELNIVDNGDEMTKSVGEYDRNKDTLAKEASIYINQTFSVDTASFYSTEGGPSSFTGNSWYFAVYYHDGVPILRGFVKWEKFVITAHNGKLIDQFASYGVTIGGTYTVGDTADSRTIYLAEGEKDLLFLNYRGLNTHLYSSFNYVDFITKKRDNVPDGNEFSGWSYTGGSGTETNPYTIEGEWPLTIYYTITFSSGGYASRSVMVGGNSSSLYSFTVEEGTTVTRSRSSYSTGKYRSITYSFTDSDGKSVTVTYSSYSGYYIYSSTGGVSSIASDTSFSVYTTIKTYKPGGVEPAPES